MTINISEIIQNDVYQLQQLFLSVRKDTFKWLNTSSYLLKDFNLETNGELILVAKNEGVVIGFISVWPPDAFIHHLFIEKDYQRIGVGKLLLNEVKNRFQTPLKLKCLKKNKAALQFYTSNNFKKIGSGVAEDGAYVLLKYSPDSAKTTTDSATTPLRVFLK